MAKADTNRRSPKKPGSFLMGLAAVLFCLVAISTHMTGSLYARYVTQDQGSDSARVAKFKITHSATTFSDEMLVGLIPGTWERTYEVTNSSEVVVAHILTVQNVTGNIPFAFCIEGGSPVKGTYQVTEYLNPGESKTITLQFHWSKEGALAYRGMVDLVSVNMESQQVD